MGIQSIWPTWIGSVCIGSELEIGHIHIHNLTSPCCTFAGSVAFANAAANSQQLEQKMACCLPGVREKQDDWVTF